MAGPKVSVVPGLYTPVRTYGGSVAHLVWTADWNASMGRRTVCRRIWVSDRTGEVAPSSLRRCGKCWDRAHALATR